MRAAMLAALFAGAALALEETLPETEQSAGGCGGLKQLKSRVLSESSYHGRIVSLGAL